MSTVTATQKTFLASPHFAVVGASKDASKYGTRVLKWYQERSFDVIPVHPVRNPVTDVSKEKEIEGLATISSIADLEDPKTTSVHIITPPKVTLAILEKAKELSVPSLWLQPGAEDEAVITYIKENDLSDRVIYGGPCILVEGDDIARSNAALL
ncbi:NAD(P)-binding protein [Pholiota conissans]|uniref:NAD(P)-binding protein n=1 Tax=Pholiota conissans TaxID=109636 RepID=A0A9P5Z6X5_9AGAR|nr:NAD(P)-binding protein [Pholiota conissans]